MTSDHDHFEKVSLKQGSYFDNNVHGQVCLNAPACERAWIYERALGYMLEGHDDRVIGEVTKMKPRNFLSTFHIDFNIR